MDKSKQLHTLKFIFRGTEGFLKFVFFLAFFYMSLVFCKISFPASMSNTEQSLLSIYTFLYDYFPLFALPFLFSEWIRNRLHTAQKPYFFLCAFGYIAVSLISNLVFKIQPEWAGIWKDLYANCKFWFCIYLGMTVFSDTTFQKYKKLIAIFLKIVLWGITVFYIFNLICDFFPDTYRFGIRQFSLFFTQPFFCGFFCATVLCMLVFVRKELRCAPLYFAMALYFLAATLEYSEFAVIIVFLLLFYFIRIRKKKLNILLIFLLALLCILIANPQFKRYFTGTEEIIARQALLIGGIFILRDYFPFGTGFATFGSIQSGKYYSAIYSKYGLSNVYGLQESYYGYVKDFYWGMVAGQGGALGLAFHLGALIFLFWEIQKRFSVNRMDYFTAMFCFLTLGILSVGFSIYTTPIGCLIALMIGASLNRRKK